MLLLMEDFIWHLLKLEIEQGRIVTGRLDPVAKIRWLRQVGELELKDAEFHQLSPIVDTIDILREERNLIVHGTWGRSQPENETIVVSLRPEGLKPDQAVAETFPDSRLRVVIDGIEKTKLDLIRLMEALHASPDRPVPKHHAD